MYAQICRGLFLLKKVWDLLDHGVRGKPMLWDFSVTASEEEKEIVWHQIARSFGMISGEFGPGLSFVVH